MNKKLVTLFCAAFIANFAFGQQEPVPLDNAIALGAAEIEAVLEPGVKAVVLNFQSPEGRFSEYVLDEMMIALMRNKRITLVDRANLELLQQEMAFQLSGEVSDSSAQSIGQLLGAQSIISGSIEDLGIYYRIRFRTIQVETAAIQVLTSINIQKDAQVAFLMGEAPPAASTETPEEALAGQPETLSLDEAIFAGVRDIEANLAVGVKAVVLNFESPQQRFSAYMLDEITTILVGNRKITVVDRANLELLQREMAFQTSGEVSDSSAQEIGQKLGAQSIISGSLQDMGNYYRIRFRTIEVETAAIQALSAFNARKDDQIAALLGARAAAPGTSAGTNRPGGPSGASRLSGAWKYSLGNILLGLGSYIQGDIPGGVIVTLGYAGAGAFLLWELAFMEYGASEAGVPGAIGIGVGGSALAFGIIKPFIFQSQRNRAVAAVMERVQVVPAMSRDGRLRSISLSYTHSF